MQAKVNIVTKSTVWEKDYYLYNNFRCISVHQGMGIESLSDGNIIVSGTVKENGSHKAAILKLNSNGDSLWSKTYFFGNTTTSDCQVNDLVITEDGGFMGVGYYSPHSSNMTAWIFKTDSNGIITGLDKPKPEQPGQNIKLYPNPASDCITFEWETSENPNGKLEIYNAVGSLMKIHNITTKKHIIKINDLTAGIYFYRLKEENNDVATGSFVVQ